MFQSRTRAALYFLVVVLVAGSVTCPAASAAAKPSKEAGIRAALDTLNSVCARRDTSAFMAMFDDDENIVLVGSSKGEVFHGRRGVARFRRFLFGMPFTFGFDLAEVTVRREGNFAWAYVDGNMLHTRADGTVSRVPYRFSVAMVERGHAWKMQMFHGSVPGAE